ncbi:MAG: peptidylprolyl isomerase [Rubricoccaceae bacterium]
MATAKTGDTVHIHYTGRLDDGTVFDSSEGREPLAFTLGEGQVIPGFEHGVAGMAEGEQKTITIPVEEAYGPYESRLVLNVPRAQFPEDYEPEIGQRLQVGLEDGSVLEVEVVGVGDETVSLDANHPLAGEALTFDLSLVRIGA